MVDFVLAKARRDATEAEIEAQPEWQTPVWLLEFKRWVLKKIKKTAS